MKSRLRIILILGCVIFVLPAAVYARDKNRHLAELTDKEINQRLSFIEHRLSAGQKQARYWQQGWTGFYAGATVIQGALAATDDDRDERVYFLFGALKAGAGLADVLLRPLPGRHGAEKLQAMPSATREEKIQRLLLAEETLYNAAERAGEKKALKSHLKVAGVNIVTGSLIWAFGDNNDALKSTAIGLVIGETAIWTQPSRARQDMQDYEDRFIQPRTPDKITWQITPFIGGIALQGRF